MAAELRSATEGRTMVLTISNLEHRNALGPEMYAAGVEALNAADGNPEVRSVVITGAGRGLGRAHALLLAHDAERHIVDRDLGVQRRRLTE